MAAPARHEGRFLGGRPPYGYMIGDLGPHPNPSKAAVGQRLHRLEPDPITSLVVKRIFCDYLSGKGLYAIAEGLTRDGIPSPSAHDPARNRHRDGRAWSKSAVRAILRNPRYTGRQVWNRQRRDEVLLDIEDVAAGHETKLRWNDETQWVWSTSQVHEALVSPVDFEAVRQQMAAGTHRPTTRKGRTTSRHYALTGLIRCSLCGRRMAGHWNHDAAHYRCRFPAEYALANKVLHPKTVYVRESSIVPRLDEWISDLFSPEQLDQTCETLAVASQESTTNEARAEAARMMIVDCDRRLKQYRATLDAGADPALVAGWMAEVQGERLLAERDLAEAAPPAALTKEQIRTLVLSLRDIAQVLATADPKLKAEVYSELGIEITYNHVARLVSVTAGPNACATERVGEGT
jgi:site-specific DNA recombinase